MRKGESEEGRDEGRERGRKGEMQGGREGGRGRERIVMDMHITC